MKLLPICPPSTPKCSGLTIDHFVNAGLRYEGKDIIKIRCRHLVGKACHGMGTAISNDFPMPLDPLTRVGFSQQGNNNNINYESKLKDTLPFRMQRRNNKQWNVLLLFGIMSQFFPSLEIGGRVKDY
eukprot:15367127-Ditylum_brightwellii.AAC.1